MSSFNLFLSLQGRFGNGNGQEYLGSYKLEYLDKGGRWKSYTSAEGRTVRSVQSVSKRKSQGGTRGSFFGITFTCTIF